MPHSIIHGNACFAYFNKIWGILYVESDGSDFKEKVGFEK
jgi:hypothetical protein